MVKKLLTILLVSLMVLTLTGCNSKKEETIKVEEPTVQEATKEETKQEEVTTEPVVEEKPTVEETAPVEVVEEVTEDTVDITTLSYWVNFLNSDGSVISRKAYKYGDTPVYPTNPEYFDGVAYYSFNSWDKKLSPVHMTQTYKALYDVTGYVYHETASVPVQSEDDSSQKSLRITQASGSPVCISNISFSEYKYEDGDKWSDKAPVSISVTFKVDSNNTLNERVNGYVGNTYTVDLLFEEITEGLNIMWGFLPPLEECDTLPAVIALNSSNCSNFFAAIMSAAKDNDEIQNLYLYLDMAG